MSKVVKFGVALGLLVALWTFFMGFTGWYKDPVLLNLFFAVIPIQILVLIYGLRQTAKQGRSYLAQVVAGSSMSVIAGILIFCNSLLFTTVVFPNYFGDIRAVSTEMMRSQGLSEADITARMALEAQFQTPFWQALFGFIGTVATGLVSSLVIAAFFRKR